MEEIDKEKMERKGKEEDEVERKWRREKEKINKK
jgi:hypothetical protein